MKKILLYVMSVLYLLAGINHFLSTRQYVAIVPDWLPWHRALVYISGILEIIYGLLLLPRSTRRLSALLIISLLIAVFPANVQMAFNYHKEKNPRFWLTVARLPLQFVLIYWAYVYTKDDNKEEIENNEQSSSPPAG